jgi:PAS domain S-box-containing protein
MFDLLDKMVDAMLVINETGIIQFLNVAAEAKFGWKKEEAIGRNVKILMPKDVGDVHDAYLKRYLETKSARIIGVGREVVAQRKDGSMFPVYLSVTEQALDGKPLTHHLLFDCVRHARTESHRFGFQLADDCSPASLGTSRRRSRGPRPSCSSSER